MVWNFYIYHCGSRVINSVSINDNSLEQAKEIMTNFNTEQISFNEIHCKYCLAFVIKMLEKNEYKSYLVYENKDLSNDKEIIYSTLYGFREKDENYISFKNNPSKFTIEFDNEKLVAYSPNKGISSKSAMNIIEKIFFRNINKIPKEITLKHNDERDIIIKTPFLNYITKIVYTEFLVD
ncbi:hypothetical protein [Mycoplasmopsis pullorum]|uniref:hypothetical protein n=1 Tax=Mycoplasmopsis pullorum TaxID=48003 RepID=UPI001118E15C|nr:hypothetical protein [Mycoplasmopsis pullorum]TNK82793.1 hypothetical protein C4M93_03505 [Mycoplasmopsis pullorum]TNK91713.1 hypothetical protein C4M96_03650 [Mycoplasmopsis pullorum]